MKKHFFAGILVLSVSLLANANITIDNVEFTIDTIARYQAGPGTWYTQVRLLRASDQKKRHDVYLLQVDRTNPYIHYHTVLANDRLIGTEQPSAMAQRKSEPGKVYFAGTNGDFYNSGFRGFKSGVPDGTFITERTIAHTPLQGREPQPSTIFDSQNHFYFGRNLSTDVYVVRANGDSMRCNHVNYDRYDNELVLYNRYNGATTLTETTDGTEVVCRINEGQSWTTNGTMTVTVESVNINAKATALDSEHVVLSGVGTQKAYVESLTQGEVLTLDIHTWLHTEGINEEPGTKVNYYEGNYVPRYSGVYDMDSVAVDFTGALGGQDKERFLINGVILETWAENHPRTAIGASRTGDTIMQVVVDGRGASTGMTTGQMGQLMAYFGAWNAMNMEGGGSSAMYIRHRGVVNSPSDNGVERSESNGLFVVCDAPEDNVPARLVPYKPTFRLPKYGFARPQFMSYNQYDLMLSYDEQDLHLSCDPSVGYVLEDSVTFVALNSGILTVRSGNARYDIPVSVATDAEPELRLDSILIDAWTNYAIELSATVDDRSMGIMPGALTWTFDDNQVAQVTNLGVLNGVHNGVTLLHGAIGAFSDDMQVRVEIAPSQTLPVPLIMDTTISYSSTRNATMVFPCDLRLYSRPDSLLITIQTNAPISYMEVQVQADNAAQPQTRKMAQSVPQNVEFTYHVALSDLLEYDVANYPIVLHQLKFALKDPAKNTPYRMQIKDVQTKYLHWQDPSYIPDLLMPSSSVSHKCIRSSRLVIIRDGIAYDVLGNPMK